MSLTSKKWNATVGNLQYTVNNACSGTGTVVANISCSSGQIICYNVLKA